MPVGSKVNPTHLRYRKRSRIRHGKSFLKLIADLQTLLNGTGAAKAATFAASAAVTITAHGYSVGAGPFLLSNAGGALPSPYAAGTFYWVVAAPDANTVNLGLTRGGAAIVAAGAGTGTHTLTKASNVEAIYQLLKRRGATVMKATTDVDNV